ncbi:MAG: transcriptional regulator [Alphaproteobacteria bacterium]|nr:transcriptional regulator [Alphaproteobacteria bacterium]MBL6936858.1 transcriptional regulator [Alphaproteobacteria bacterium]MBL7097627.1 transcriptional regulator [Alphaproteobacteria bacterium]
MVDEVIHQSMRLKIMSSLNVLGRNDWLDFARLKSILDTTDGNLGAHLETLAKAGYIAVEKRFEGKRPQTRVRATPTGRKAFTEHVAYLRSILDNS